MTVLLVMLSVRNVILRLFVRNALLISESSILIVIAISVIKNLELLIVLPNAPLDFMEAPQLCIVKDVMVNAQPVMVLILLIVQPVLVLHISYMDKLVMPIVLQVIMKVLNRFVGSVRRLALYVPVLRLRVLIVLMVISMMAVLDALPVLITVKSVLMPLVVRHVTLITI